jgi:hypothetical protein
MAEADDIDPAPRREEIEVFALGGRNFTVEEILRAAQFRGEMTPHWRDLMLKLASHEHAVSQGLEPDSAAVQAKADQFRYERDLITSEETEAWLAKRGLESDHFSTHVLHSYWKEAVGDKIAVPPEPVEADTDLRAQLTIELLLTGAFAYMARGLAWRLASFLHKDPSTAHAAESIESEREQFFRRTGVETGSLADWLESVGGDETWFEEMLRLEAAYRQRAATIVTPERLTRALRSQRLGLTQFELEEIEFDAMEAAREAVLCVREDNLSMEEVARESRFPYSCREYLLEELPQEWQMPLLSTPEGGLAGPYAEGDLIRLFRVRSKTEPVITNEAIRQRLEEHLVQTYFEELCAEQGYKPLW